MRLRLERNDRGPVILRHVHFEQPHLPQHRRLLPIHALARDFTVAELHDDDDVDVDRLMRGWYAGEEPFHRPIVSESDGSSQSFSKSRDVIR
jgi:hypothetical protein